MAFTYSTDGVVQPFSEVACDKVTSAVRSAMSGGDFAKADVLAGTRAGTGAGARSGAHAVEIGSARARPAWPGRRSRAAS